MKFIQQNRRWITIILSFLGIVDMAYYIGCSDSCEYLRGDLFCIDLKYMGFAFMLFLAGLAHLYFFQVVRLLVAGALGGELYLLGYQLYQGMYCKYCLLFAGLVIGAFLVNYEPAGDWTRRKRWLYLLGEINMGRRNRRYPLIVFTLLGFVIFILGFSGSTTPAYGEQIIPAYGGGTMEIRFYSDYFCPACRLVEPEIEPFMSNLTAKNKARVSFMDVPIHKESLLYIKYFLYYAKGNESFEEVIRFRKILFEAAEKGVRTEQDLRKYLGEHGALPQVRDISVPLQVLRNYFIGDKIKATPTMVVVESGSRKSYIGKAGIMAALKYYKTEGIQ
jgi:thiol:disulfide interchange protein DsbA